MHCGSIECIADAVQVGTTLTHSWFRGHDRRYSLEPRVFRLARKKRVGWTIERDLIYSFMRRSPDLAERIPGNDDLIEWLFLMQHYGTPTRLLDWTESVLVALYFAVRNTDDDGANGELWAMNPWQLNHRAAPKPFRGLPVQQWCKEVRGLAAIAFRRCSGEHPADNLACTVDELKGLSGPIPFKPPLRFARMALQQSAFTIHVVKPKDDSRGYDIGDCQTSELLIPTINDVLHDDSRFLARYVVPRSCKKRIRKDLSSLGFDEHTLFHDLDSLSRTLNRHAGEAGWLTDTYSKRSRPQDFPEAPQLGS